MKQCTVLFVNPDRQESAHPDAMRGMGFLVDEVTEWPDDNGIVRNYHVVIVHVRKMNGAPMLAARLRAKPHFGRRLLIALVPADTPQADRRAAEASGFDDVMNDCCDSRHSDDADPARAADAAGASLCAAAADFEAVGGAESFRLKPEATRIANRGRPLVPYVSRSS